MMASNGDDGAVFVEAGEFRVDVAGAARYGFSQKNQRSTDGLVERGMAFSAEAVLHMRTLEETLQKYMPEGVIIQHRPTVDLGGDEWVVRSVVTGRAVRLTRLNLLSVRDPLAAVVYAARAVSEVRPASNGYQH